ncbi:HD domain-containing phosphohydrolase [Kyrpidia tusciae]|uniref:PAS/PAC sensor protein n=1 Tax=Kyrpidia tusciae (strain DSM 2912 / NBRC 15312 / T2) TaxID=562970 RepID=D5WQX4_KYRT2|nr:HD domain-containing phosphohydrolase [Kyrpidia tusciae]ADG06733.1 putative PAS/PAC sensor protein [Kyrpidia tusciae DSM 2912]
MENWYAPYMLLDDPVMVADARHRLLAVNPAYERASGFRCEELVGQDAVYAKPKGLFPGTSASVCEHLERGQGWKGIVSSARADGGVWNFSLTVTPVRTFGQVYYLGVCRDVEDVSYQTIAESHEQLFWLIAQMAEADDPSVAHHLDRVSRLSRSLAGWLGWPEGRARWLGMAAVMHDVGKLYIPREILFKPGPLTPAERQLVETHTTRGAELLTRFSENMARIYGYNEALFMAREIAQCHHEHVDGSGYPQGLQGDEIPESARIVALADVTDALFSHRPYKVPWAASKVQGYLRAKSGHQFDPGMVRVLLDHWKEVEQLYRLQPAISTGVIGTG